MYRKLLATTALSLLIASGATAQDMAPDPMLDDPAMGDPGMEAVEEPPADPLVEPSELGINADGWLATEIIGMDIENSTAEDAETIGEVSDIVLNVQGEAAAVIVGVGGFLGIGQKDVAIAFDELELVVDADGNETLVADRTREQLENAQDFDPTVWLASENAGGWFDLGPGDDDVDAVDADDDAALDTDDDALNGDDDGLEDDAALDADEPADAADDADEPALDADPAAEDDDAALNGDDDAMNGDDALNGDDDAMNGDDAEMNGDDAVNGDDAALDADPAVETEDPDAAPADPAVEGDDAAAMDPEAGLAWDTFQTVAVSEISADELTGTTVYGANDEDIGSIGDVILSDSGEAEAVIIDFGGFLGIGAKPVAVSFAELDFYEDEGGNLVLRTSLTEEELEAAPEYDEDAYIAAPGDETTTVTVQ